MAAVPQPGEQTAELAGIVRWIERQPLGMRPPLTTERIGNGRSNLTYLVTDAAGASLVARRPPTGDLLPTAHDVGREHRILEALQDTGVAVPAVLGFAPAGEAGPAPVLLLEHVAGLTLDSEASARAIAPPLRRALGLSMADALAEIHAVDLARAGLDDLASQAPYAGRQLRRWRRQWEAAAGAQSAEVDEIGALLERNRPREDEVRLVHGDFHALNVIVDESDGRVRAVLDWELCTLGDPLADLGGLLAYWPEAGDDLAPGPISFTALAGFPTRRQVADRYAQASGRDLASLGFWTTLACWKIAIIMHGVRERAGPGAPAATVVDAMLARARRAADEAGLT